MKSRSANSTFMVRQRWLMAINDSRESYVKKYNKLSENGDPTTATATLFKIKKGIEELIISNQESIKEMMAVIIEYLESEVEAGENLTDLAKMLLSTAKQFHVPDVLRSKFNGAMNTSFELGLKRYYSMYESEYWHVSEVNLGRIISLKKEVNNFQVDVLSLESLLKNVVQNDYPKEIKNISAKEIEEELSGAGRKDDESAPQEPITNLVKQLINNAKAVKRGETISSEEDILASLPEENKLRYQDFWHFKGAHKESPNKGKLTEAVFAMNLNGDIATNKGVKNRVARALKKLGY